MGVLHRFFFFYLLAKGWMGGDGAAVAPRTISPARIVAQRSAPTGGGAGALPNRRGDQGEALIGARMVWATRALAAFGDLSSWLIIGNMVSLKTEQEEICGCHVAWSV